MKHIAWHLKNVYFQNKMGQLTFRHEKTIKHIFFQDGYLIFAKTNKQEELLGEVLFKLGKLSDEAFARIDDYIEPKKNIGRNLVEDHLISKEDLREGLIYQMREIILNTFSEFEGNFKFQEKEVSIEQEFEVRIGIPTLIEDGIRRMKYDPQLKIFMEKKTCFRKSKSFFYRLTEEEKEILEIIKENSTPETILHSSGLNPELFWKSLYLFYCLDLIDVQTEGKKATSDIPETKKSQKELDDLIAFHGRLQNMNYYEILDVPRIASPSELKTAYFNLARKYHPDLFERDLPSETKDIISDIFDKITQAYSTLNNPVMRREYNEKENLPKGNVKKGSKEAANVKFLQAKTLYNKGRYEEARLLLKEAVRLNKDKANYYLLLALAESKIPSYVKKAEQNFLQAAKLEPWSAESYVGLGLMYKKEGLKFKASKQFRKALSIEPNHQIALTELGLTGKDGKKKGLKGIFSFDLFGKKKK